MTDLSKQVVVVTGAAGGFGKSFTNAFLAAGAKIAALDVFEEGLVKLSNDHRGVNEQNLKTWKINIANFDNCKMVVDDVVKHFGGLDVLINNAGISDPVAAIDEDLDEFRRVIQIDLVSCFFLAQLSAKIMKEQDSGGSIVNVASIHGFVGSAPNNQPGYSAAKGGLVNLTRELALEWARFGIRVNALAPGYVATELTDEMIAGDSGRKWIERNTPLRRPAAVNELDGAMLLLASDAGSYITGETIAVDGGWLAR